MLFLINTKSYSQNDDMYSHPRPLPSPVIKKESKVDERFKEEYEKYVGIWENKDVTFKIYTDSIVIIKNTSVIHFKVIKPVHIGFSNAGVVKNGLYVQMERLIHHPLLGALKEEYTVYITPFDDIRIILEIFYKEDYSEKNIMYQKLTKR